MHNACEGSQKTFNQATLSWLQCFGHQVQGQPGKVPAGHGTEITGQAAIRLLIGENSIAMLRDQSL